MSDIKDYQEPKNETEAKFQYYTKEKIRQQVSKYTLTIPEADKEDVVQKVRDILLKNTCSDGSSRNAQAVCFACLAKSSQRKETSVIVFSTTPPVLEPVSK
uniref:Uncharacterized protein n=1 Tax=Acrobeloides nanus TaxID=290746 RepID=A0A914DVP6_9BILA